MPLFHHKTIHIKSLLYTTALLCFTKNPIPWRDSNPGLLYLRRMQCALRHAAGATFFIPSLQNNHYKTEPR
jgi:hypothetical protein